MNPSHCAVFLFLLAAASLSSLCYAKITSCYQVIGDFIPCVRYLTGPTGEKPSKACCDGAKALVAAATSKEDKLEACVCAKYASEDYPINYENAKKLPDFCNIKLPFVLSPDLNCDK